VSTVDKGTITLAVLAALTYLTGNPLRHLGARLIRRLARWLRAQWRARTGPQAGRHQPRRDPRAAAPATPTAGKEAPAPVLPLPGAGASIHAQPPLGQLVQPPLGHLFACPPRYDGRIVIGQGAIAVVRDRYPVLVETDPDVFPRWYRAYLERQEGLVAA